MYLFHFDENSRLKASHSSFSESSPEVPDSTSGCTSQSVYEWIDDGHKNGIEGRDHFPCSEEW